MTASSTATVLDRPVLAAVEAAQVPFWRFVLRGCQWCCFQTNEVTGAIFLLAVLACSWKMVSFMLVGAIVGPAVALLLEGRRPPVELGLFGFDSCRMALALGNFFAHGPALWAAVVVLAAVVAVVAWLLMRLIPIPVIASPFILTFWIFWPLAEPLGLDKLPFPPFIDERVLYLQASLAALGASPCNRRPRATGPAPWPREASSPKAASARRPPALRSRLGPGSPQSALACPGRCGGAAQAGQVERVLRGETGHGIEDSFLHRERAWRTPCWQSMAR